MTEPIALLLETDLICGDCPEADTHSGNLEFQRRLQANPRPPLEAGYEALQQFVSQILDDFGNEGIRLVEKVKKKDERGVQIVGFYLVERDLEKKVMHLLMVEITDFQNETDVVCGKGSFANNNPGNQAFFRRIVPLRLQYKSLPDSQKDPYGNARRLEMEGEGIRFVERRVRGRNQRFFLVEHQETKVEKIKRFLRETRVPNEIQNDDLDHDEGDNVRFDDVQHEEFEQEPPLLHGTVNQAPTAGNLVTAFSGMGMGDSTGWSENFDAAIDPPPAVRRDLFDANVVVRQNIISGSVQQVEQWLLAR